MPIPLSLGGGALTASATVDGVDTPFPVLVDTGTPLTGYDDHTMAVHARTGHFRLFSAETPPVERLLLEDVELFVTPLRSVGLAGSEVPLSGVLGGDNLERFAASFDYRGAPALTLSSIVTTCSCELADDCHAVLPFQLEGGQLAVDVGGDLFDYPASRVVLDGCLEPLADPIAADVVCPVPTPDPDAVAAGVTPAPLLNQTDSRVQLAPQYQPSGVELRLLVSTGFPGLAVSASAWDRLRGPGASSALLAGAQAVQLHLPSPSDDGADGGGLTVGAAEVGGGQTSALALVSREGYYGPCGELARSRRQRRFPPQQEIPTGDPRNDEVACLRDETSRDPYVEGCRVATSNSTVCDDEQTPVAAVLELAGPLPVLVLADTAPLLQGINADVRPGHAAIEGIVGTEVLRRLVSTIDYPNRRFIAQCAEATGCTTYPRYEVNHYSECGRECTPTKCLYAPSLVASGECPQRGPGGACGPAPARATP